MTRSRRKKLRRYVVITADSSEDEIYQDLVLAHSKRGALKKIVDIRGPGSDGHLVADGFCPSVFTPGDLRRLAARLENMTEAKATRILEGIKESYE